MAEPKLPNQFNHHVDSPLNVIPPDVHNLEYRLHPLHWADLLKSHLTPESILASGIFSCPPDLISKILGFNHPDVVSALCFPYPRTNFTRLKIFPTLKDKKGSKIKYLQRKDSGSHLYFSPNFLERAKDSSAEIWICEGEKKTIFTYQNGFCAMGIGGVWSWRDKATKGLISSFDLISWKGREVKLLPDGDFIFNPLVRAGACGLAEKLKARGARVKLIDLNKIRRTYANAA